MAGPNVAGGAALAGPGCPQATVSLYPLRRLVAGGDPSKVPAKSKKNRYIYMVHESFTPPPPLFTPPPPWCPPNCPKLANLHSRTGGAHTRRYIHKAVHTKGGL